MRSQDTDKKTNPGQEEISLKVFFLSLRYFFKYLKAKWLIIVVAVLAGGCLGLVYSFFKKPIYTAELSFVLEDEKSSGLGAAAGLASQFGLDLGSSTNGAFTGDNLIELLKSRSMVDKTLLTEVVILGHKETLAELYISVNDFRAGWKDVGQLRNLTFDPMQSQNSLSIVQDSLLGIFHKQIIKSSLSVDKVDKKLSIITVKVNSINELFAKFFAESLVKNVSDFYIETKTKKEAQNVAILQHQTDSVRKALNYAILGVASSLDVNPNPNPSLQVLRIPSQRRQVDVQANTAILTELVRNLELSKITLRKETPLFQIIDSPILPLDKEKLGKVKATVYGSLLAVFLVIVFCGVVLIFKDVMK